ncbi:MAG: hypothetical protein J07HX64_00873 [halophilic archaeon J07HX64]|nr:MAG: hypothetical protein J07HX64_00873 [halophilic archaeon J07HX64]
MTVDSPAWSGNRRALDSPDRTVRIGGVGYQQFLAGSQTDREFIFEHVPTSRYGG